LGCLFVSLSFNVIASIINTKEFGHITNKI
jgi:hypothetical protein